MLEAQRKLLSRKGLRREAGTGMENPINPFKKLHS